MTSVHEDHQQRRAEENEHGRRYTGEEQSDAHDDSAGRGQLHMLSLHHSLVTAETGVSTNTAGDRP
ncbi:hypothetical protein [Prauserella muralis]|uniref:hypothetical protein n=1 Tax=Prauserella muralis TaxID=588067 RepID=UPI0011BF5807|nr:hypothetical protein [Prauserella muralis]